jgi:hypothetical protein
MPGFDGTGPQGRGPLTGGGRGYCALRIPASGTDQATVGYAGLEGSPVAYTPTAAPLAWIGRGSRGRGGRRGRGRAGR